MYTAWAFLSLGESEAITGLYVWCRQEGDRKLPWLKPIADHAGGRQVSAKDFSTSSFTHLLK